MGFEKFWSLEEVLERRFGQYFDYSPIVYLFSVFLGFHFYASLSVLLSLSFFGALDMKIIIARIFSREVDTL